MGLGLGEAIGIVNPVGAIGTVLAGGTELIGAKMNADAQEEASRRNAELQREFAQHGVRWKVEDAKAAGIHPLYALGANTHSFSPSYVGDNSMGNAVASMGQNITRAISATRTAEERQVANLRLATAQAELDGKVIDNQIRAQQLREMTAVGPGFPMSGVDRFLDGSQGALGPVMVTQSKRPAHAPGARHVEAAIPADVQFSHGQHGLVPMIPQGVSESYESNPLGAVEWAIRNSYVPRLTSNFDLLGNVPGLGFLKNDYGKPPRSQWPKGATNMYMGLDGQWRPLYKEKVYRKGR